MIVCYFAAANMFFSYNNVFVMVFLVVVPNLCMGQFKIIGLLDANSDTLDNSSSAAIVKLNKFVDDTELFQTNQARGFTNSNSNNVNEENSKDHEVNNGAGDNSENANSNVIKVHIMGEKMPIILDNEPTVDNNAVRHNNALDDEIKQTVEPIKPHQS